MHQRIYRGSSAEKQQELASIPPGECVEVVIYRKKFAGMVYKTIRLVGEAMGRPTGTIGGWLAIKAGYVDFVRWPPDDSHAQAVPHSMADMDVAELEAFWEDACEVIRKEVLPHVDAMAAGKISRRLTAGSPRPLRARR